MKYKRKQIHKLKERFNIERLHFFKGYREIKEIILKSRSAGITTIGQPMRANFATDMIICSIERNYKKVYRNHPYIHVTRRMNHKEVGRIIEGLVNKGWCTTKWGKLHIFPVRFEQTDTEHTDLESLKEAYLIHYLSGI